MATAAIRQPASFYLDSDTGPVLTFDPPLTAQEQAVYTGLVDVARSPVSITPAEYDAIRPQLQDLRDLRQLGRNAFMALTAAERDRQLYDAQTNTTIILLALLRG